MSTDKNEGGVIQPRQYIHQKHKNELIKICKNPWLKKGE